MSEFEWVGSRSLFAWIKLEDDGGTLRAEARWESFNNYTTIQTDTYETDIPNWPNFLGFPRFIARKVAHAAPECQYYTEEGRNAMRAAALLEGHDPSRVDHHFVCPARTMQVALHWDRTLQTLIRNSYDDHTRYHMARRHHDDVDGLTGDQDSAIERTLRCSERRFNSAPEWSLYGTHRRSIGSPAWHSVLRIPGRK